jgi:Glu-tRNA(Gln) amidotransferase subunit E-like FAD-binding protein
MTLVSALLIGLGALSSVVLVLWKRSSSESEATQKKLEKYETTIQKELEECRQHRHDLTMEFLRGFNTLSDRIRHIAAQTGVAISDMPDLKKSED